MNKKEFLEKMENTKAVVQGKGEIEKGKPNKGCEGVCVALAWSFGTSGNYLYRVDKFFEHIYRDNYDKNNDPYWLGIVNNHNVSKRLQVLSDFKNLLLDTEMYKEL